MKKKSSSKIMYLPLLLLGLLSLNSAHTIADNSKTPEPHKKNIIFIMADDLGYGDLGVYGQTKIQTPNIDKMAAEGMRFTDFYAGATVCAPSRSVLMTGVHGGRTPIRGNATKEIQTLAPEDITVAEVLKSAGYKTALIGKWGLGDDGNTGLPNDQGFDYFFGFLNQVHAHNHYPDFLWRNKTKLPLPNKVTLAPFAYMNFHGGVALKEEDRIVYSEDLFLKESLEYIDKAGKDPFFLYLSFITPHANNEAEKFPGVHGMMSPSYGIYKDKPWPESAKGYASMVTNLDQSVGAILKKLKEKGLDENTLVIFTSDNGTHDEGSNDPAFFKSSGPLNNYKRSMHDGGIRVPFIVRNPGTVPAGKVSNHIGYFGDMMATFADFASATLPPSRDSISLKETFLGGSSKSHDYLYWEFYELGSSQAVRFGSWKAIRSPMKTGKIKLYNLEKDIGERNDVAASYPDLVARAASYMDQAHHDDPRWKPIENMAGRD